MGHPIAYIQVSGRIKTDCYPITGLRWVLRSLRHHIGY